MSYKDKLTFKMATNYSLDAPKKKKTDTKKSTSEKSSSSNGKSTNNSSKNTKSANTTPQQKTSAAANKDVRINPIKVDGKINPIISDNEAKNKKVNLQTADGKQFGEISVSAYGAIRGNYLDKYTPVDDGEKKVLDSYTSYLNKQIVEIPITDKKTLTIKYGTAKGIDDYVDSISGEKNKNKRAKMLDDYVKNLGLTPREYESAYSYAGLKKLDMASGSNGKNSAVKELTQPIAKFLKGAYDTAESASRFFIKSGLNGLLDGGQYNKFRNEAIKHYEANPDELGHDLFNGSAQNTGAWGDYLNKISIDKGMEFYNDTTDATKFISDVGFYNAGQMLGSAALANMAGVPAVMSGVSNTIGKISSGTKVGNAVQKVANAAPAIKNVAGGGVVGKVANATINKVNNTSVKSVAKFLNPFDNPATAIMGIGAAQNKYDQLVKMGYDEDTARTSAMFTGYINAITEKMGYDGTNGASVRLFPYKGASLASDAVASTSKYAGNILKKYLSANVSEGLEEIYANVFERAGDYFLGVGYVDSNGKLQQRKIFGDGGVFDTKAIGESFLGGFVGGTVMGGVGTISRVANMNIDDVRAFADDIKLTTDAVNEAIAKEAEKAGMKNVEMPKPIDFGTATVEEINKYYEDCVKAYTDILSNPSVEENDSTVVKRAISTLPADNGDADGTFMTAEDINTYDGIVTEDYESSPKASLVSIGDTFKDTKTGNTIRIISQDADNTVVEIDTGKKVEQRSYTNAQANVLETNAQYQKLPATSLTNGATQTDTMSQEESGVTETSEVLSPEEAQVYNIVVSNLKRKAEELGLLDDTFYRTLQNVSMYRPSESDRALISNEFHRVFAENIDPLVVNWLDAISVNTQSVAGANEQKLPVAGESIVSNESIPKTDADTTGAKIKPVVDAVNETLLPGARETIIANMEKMGIKGDIEVFAKRMMDVYAEKGTIGKLADYFSDGGEKVVAAMQGNDIVRYTDKEKQNWKNSNSIIVYESDEQFETFIEKVLKNEDIHKKIYFGKVPDATAQMVLDKTGVDVSGHNIALKGYEIRKILLNSHGDEKVEVARGQEPITTDDLKNIPSVITNPDDVSLSEKEYEGKPALLFEKNIDGKNYVVTYVSRKHHDIAIQTMYKKRSLATAENANALSSTPETTSSTASNNIISQENNIVNNSVRTDAEKDTKTAKVAKAIESSLRPEIASNPTLMAMLQQRFGEDGFTALASDIILTYNQNGNIGEHAALFADGGKAVYDALADNTDAKISTDVLNDETNSDIINNDNDIETSYSIDADDSTLYLPRREYAMVARAIMAKNAGLKDSELKPVDFVYAADAFYVYRNTAVGDFTVIDRFDVEDDFERINDVKERIDDGTYADRKGFSGWFKDIRSRERSDTRDNERSKNRRAAVEDDRVLGGQSRSNSVRHSTTTGKDSSSDEVSYAFDANETLGSEEYNDEQTGDSLSNGGSEWQNSKRPRQSAKRVDGRSRRYKEGRRTASERREYCKALKDAGNTIRKVIFGHQCEVIQKEHYTKRMTNIEKRNVKNGIDETIFITGKATLPFLKDKNGNPKTTKGIFIKTKDGRKIVVVQYDHDLFMPEQINDHELVHKDFKSSRAQKVKNLIINSLSVVERKNILERLSRDYNGIIKNNEEKIFEEFVANTLSGMNEYTSQFDELVKAYWTEDDALIDAFRVSEYVESIDSGDSKNDYIVDVFPPYNESHSEANTISTIWAHKKSVAEGTQRIVSYHDSMYIIQKTNEKDLKYQIVRQVSQSELDAWNRYKKRSERNAKNKGKQQRRETSFFLDGENRGANSDRREQLDTYNDTDKFNGKTENVSELGREQDGWGKLENRRNRNNEYDLINSSAPDKSSNEINQDFNVPYNESKQLKEYIMSVNNSRKKLKLTDCKEMGNHFYVWKNHSKSDYTVTNMFEIDGNDDLINFVRKGMKNGTFGKTKDLRQYFNEFNARGRSDDRSGAAFTDRQAYGRNGGVFEEKYSRRHTDDRRRQGFGESVGDTSSDEINPSSEVEDISYSSVPQITKIKYSPSGLKLTAAEREKVYSAISTDYYNQNKTHEGLQYQSCVTDTGHILYIYEDGGFGHYNVVAKVDYADEDIANLIVEELRNGTTYRITDFINRAIKVLELRRSSYSVHNTRTKRSRRSRGNVAVHSGLSQGNAENTKGRTSKRVDGSGIGNSKREKIDTSAEVEEISYSLAGENTDFWDEWLSKIEEYGAIPTGENPARDIEVPKRINKKQYVSRFARTMMEAEVTPDEALPEFERLILEGKMTHEVVSNKKAREGAIDKIKREGFAETLNTWDVMSKESKIGKKELALGMELYNQCITNKDITNAMKIAADLAAEATRAGQTLQACRMLKLMSPDGQLYYLERSVKKMNDEFRQKIGKKFKDIELDETLMTEFFNAPDEESRNAAYDKICQNIADQIPSTMRDKWNSWRYLAMLGNPRTHIRNIVGNAVFVPAIRIKNYVGAVIENTARVSTADRTKSIKKSKVAVEFAKRDFDVMENTIRGENAKYAITSDIDSKRTIFKTKWLEKLRIKNFDFLEAEDLWFLKRHYVDALARVITARKLDVNTLDGNALDTARAYAIKEAQAATYRDANELADALSKLQRKAERSDSKIIRGTSTLIEGVMPFKKTPMNIAKQGVQYSPVSVVTGVYKGLKRLKDGEAYSASDVVDDFSKGLTGTGIMLLGYFLTSIGALCGPDDEDKKKRAFDKMVGEQSYALKVGDNTYTIDWMVPSALPLFVGTELYKLTQDGFEFADVINATSTLVEPLLELSVFSGVSDTIESAQFNDINSIFAMGNDMVSSYILQALPTVGGQLSRIIDKNKRQYYYRDKTSDIPWMIQNFVGQASSKIPFASYLFAPVVDEWGREVTYGNVFERVFENTASPGYYSETKYTYVDKELQDLYERTGENKVLPIIQQKYFTSEYVKYHMTAEEYADTKKMRGQRSFELLESLFGNKKAYKTQKKRYSNMTDEEKIKAIEKCYKIAGEETKDEMLDRIKN